MNNISSGKFFYCTLYVAIRTKFLNSYTIIDQQILKLIIHIPPAYAIIKHHELLRPSDLLKVWNNYSSVFSLE